MAGKIRIKFKSDVLENACLVARAIHQMTHSQFTEGYNLIKDMQGSEFLTALRMLAEHEVMIKKLSDFEVRDTPTSTHAKAARPGAQRTT